MANYVKTVDCNKCKSSRGGALYDDNSFYCHKCGAFEKNYGGEMPPTQTQARRQQPTMNQSEHQDIHERGITQETCKFWDYKIDKQGVHYATFKNSAGSICAIKKRDRNKNFAWEGKPDGLYGQWLWAEGGKMLVITEGEIDALTVSQVNGLKWPVVSLVNGGNDTGACPKEILKNLEYIESFEKVILLMDNDKVGHATAQAIAETLEPGKTYIAHLEYKDANDALVKGKSKEIANAIWQARAWKPEDIITPGDLTRAELLEIVRPGLELPFPVLDECIGGLKKGNMYTIGAKPKRGKTTVTKEMVLHLLENGHKVGLMYLEESHFQALASLVAMKEGVPFHKLEESLKGVGGVDKLLEKIHNFYPDQLIAYRHKGAIDIDTLKSKLRFMMVGENCDLVILDNISLAVAGQKGGEGERKNIDVAVAEIVKILKNSKSALINVVHVTKSANDKDGKDTEFIQPQHIRGSGAFEMFSDVLMAIERSGEDKIKLKVLANRTKGIVKYCDELRYNRKTGRLEPELAQREIEMPTFEEEEGRF